MFSVVRSLGGSPLLPYNWHRSLWCWIILPSRPTSCPTSLLGCSIKQISVLTIVQCFPTTPYLWKLKVFLFYFLLFDRFPLPKAFQLGDDFQSQIKAKLWKPISRTNPDTSNKSRSSSTIAFFLFPWKLYRSAHNCARNFKPSSANSKIADCKINHCFILKVFHPQSLVNLTYLAFNDQFICLFPTKYIYICHFVNFCERRSLQWRHLTKFI